MPISEVPGALPNLCSCSGVLQPVSAALFKLHVPAFPGAFPVGCCGQWLLSGLGWGWGGGEVVTTWEEHNVTPWVRLTEIPGVTAMHSGG